MILHITNDFAGSKVYHNLIKNLDIIGYPQIVYTPIRSKLIIGNNSIDFKNKKSIIIYSNILIRVLDSILYRIKINRIFKDIEKKRVLTGIKLIHAHTWFSDGGVANKIYKKYNIPYIVAVRSSDTSVFYKYLIHERGLGIEILKNAKYIITISPSIYNRLSNIIRYHINYRELVGKTNMIPNGVDYNWIEKRVCFNPKTKCESINIIYIGSLIKRKNVTKLQKAIIELVAEGLPIKFHIVGDSGLMKRKVVSLSHKYGEFIFFHGVVNRIDELLKLYKVCDIFAMPSSQETFGLVYIEALLQGLPVLYTSGEGIDGLYDEKIGESVENFAVSEIKNKLRLMIINYNKFKIPTEKIAKNHNWEFIAQQYEHLYKSAQLK
jgi:glycosyltransferase involved in cell wall biosynthesis